MSSKEESINEILRGATRSARRDALAARIFGIADSSESEEDDDEGREGQ